MAVHDRRYKPYTGVTTSLQSRFLVLPRYAFKDVFKSRWLVFFLGLTVLPPLIFGIMIYMRNNLGAIDRLSQLGLDVGTFYSIDEGFFASFLRWQFSCAFFLTLFVGPGLVSRDLANNGLPLYLSRPISRADYVVGKLVTLLALSSAITWIAGLLLFGLNGNMTTWGWVIENARIGLAVFVGSFLWISLLALLALALSAWVRWKVIAGFMLLAFFLVGTVVPQVINAFFRTDWGHILNAIQLVRIVTAKILGVTPPPGPPFFACIVALALMAGACLVLLNQRIRAYQVVS